MTSKKKNNYEDLAVCIKSGQVEPREIQMLFRRDRFFESWYKRKYLDTK